WALTHVDDPNRNTIDIVYSVDSTGDNGVFYPDYIRYGGNAGNVRHLFEVNFIWSDEDGFTRPAGDQMMNSMGGFAQILLRLLSRIEVRSLAEDRLIRSYQLLYDFQSGDGGLARQSFLRAVTLYDGNRQALARADGLPAATTF